MAEIESGTKIVPTSAAPAPAQPANAGPAPLSLAGRSFQVREFDSRGNETIYSFPLPSTVDFLTWTLEQQVGMLKRGVWNKISVPDIVWGLSYAHHIDAD